MNLCKTEKKPKKKNQKVIENVFEDISCDVNSNDVLSQSNEPVVDMLNIYWKKINNHIEEYTNYEEKTYVVDENLFTMKIEELEKFKKSSESESYKVYKFYKLSDDMGTQPIITSTLNNVYYCFCADLLYNLKGESDNSKFDTFKKAGATKIYVTILKIIRTKMSKGIKAELDLIRTNLEKQSGVVTPAITDKIEKQNKIVEMLLKKIIVMIGQFNIPKQKFYIQKIYSKIEPTKLYIFGSVNKLKHSELKDFVENECIGVVAVDTNLKVEIIKDIDIQLEIEGLLHVDEQIRDLNTIDNGLNKYYNMLHNENLDKSIFMIVQYELLHYKYSSLNVGKTGYIAKMRIENMNYVYTGMGTNIVDNLKYFYLMTNHNDNKNEKIIKLISSVKVDDISIQLLKRNIDEKNLKNEFVNILNKFKKEELLNYEEDVYVGQKEFKKEISGVKSLVFMSKYKKN